MHNIIIYISNKLKYFITTYVQISLNELFHIHKNKNNNNAYYNVTSD